MKMKRVYDAYGKVYYFALSSKEFINLRARVYYSTLSTESVIIL
jgi:hypothetical protein